MAWFAGLACGDGGQHHAARTADAGKLVQIEILSAHGKGGAVSGGEPVARSIVVPLALFTAGFDRSKRDGATFTSLPR